jgi:prepilin-type processing-associated H-X9-DG protein
VRTTAIKLFYCPSRRSPPKLSRVGGPDGNFPGALGDYAGCGGDRTPYNGELDGFNTTNGAPTGTMVIAKFTVTNNRLTFWRGQVPIAGIFDGTSNTFLIGERHVPISRMGSEVNQIGDASIYNGDHHRTLGRVAGTGPANSGYDFNLAQNINDLQAGTDRWQRIFGSYHPGGVQFVFCDGSVRSFPRSTRVQTLKAFANCKDGVVTVED